MSRGRSLLLAAAVLGVGILLVGRAQSAEGDQPDMDAMMAAWQAAMTPGEPHEWLAKGAGEWDLTTKMWMEGPDGPVTESTGSASAKMVLGGRFLQEELNFEMMGMPIEMINYVGYDNFKKKYVATNLSTMGTSISTMEGVRRPGSDDVVFYGLMDEPSMDMHNLPIKYVSRQIDDDHAVFEIYDLTMAEEPTKVVEVHYTRKQ